MRCIRVCLGRRVEASERSDAFQVERHLGAKSRPGAPEVFEPRQPWSCGRSGAYEPRAPTCKCGKRVCT